jgi:YbgC/YbaW family acyl-CoA thioester hydrolase
MAKRPFVISEYVRWGDIDLAGIICYGAYIRFYELAETEIFRAAGLPFREMFERFDMWLPRKVMHTEFHKPALLDDRLKVVTYFSQIGRTSLTINFDVLNAAEGTLPPPLEGSLFLLLRLHDRPAAILAAACAGILRVILGARSFALVLVVVRQLLARLNRAQCLDVDAAADDHRLAVRITGVVDVRRLVATDGAVDAGIVIEREEEGVMTVHRGVIVASIGLVVVDALAGVLDDARPLANAPHGEGAPTLDAGASELEVWIGCV